MGNSTSFYRKRLNQKAKKLNRRKPIQSCFDIMLGNKKTVTILDIGSGPFTTMGTEHSITKIIITAADDDAKIYNKMIADAGIKSLVNIEYQDMENITYPDNSFDIVCCQNAIDHTKDAIKAVNEFCRVSKTWVYMKHFPDSGARWNYKNGHFWNISCDGTLWNENNSLCLNSIGFETFGYEQIEMRLKQ